MKTIVIFEFMIKELKLSGINLLLYALIYGFSQFDQRCYMSVENICKTLGCSRAQFFRAKHILFSRDLIVYDNEGAMLTNNSDAIFDEFKENLEETIRIAKTPWVV